MPLVNPTNRYHLYDDYDKTVFTTDDISSAMDYSKTFKKRLVDTKKNQEWTPHSGWRDIENDEPVNHGFSYQN